MSPAAIGQKNTLFINLCGVGHMLIDAKNLAFGYLDETLFEGVDFCINDFGNFRIHISSLKTDTIAQSFDSYI